VYYYDIDLSINPTEFRFLDILYLQLSSSNFPKRNSDFAPVANKQNS